MLQLQYLNPITGKCVCRYFKTYKGMIKHMSQYLSETEFIFIDMDIHDDTFHHGVADKGKVYFDGDFLDD